MTGTRGLLIIMTCALAVSACATGGGEGEAADKPPVSVTVEATAEPSAPPTPAPAPTAGDLPTRDESADETKPQVQGGSPAASEPPVPATQGDGTAYRVRPDLSGVEDRTDLAVALPPPPDFDPDSVIIDEDFSTTTPVLAEFETDEGSGGIGRFGEQRFYELVMNAADGHLAVPIRGLSLTESADVYVQKVSFLSRFSGLAAMDRGLYCWAANGNDPLSGARHELLYGADGRIQVVRYDADGQPAALLIDEVWEADSAPDGPSSPISATRIGLLCRQDAEGRAEIAVRIDRQYHITTDEGSHPAGGGAGVVVAGAGRASTDTIATVGGLLVLDGTRVPIG
ncbi:hypothetical protein BH23ACT9_BH23ACT9_30180 [soil metagenome]